MFKIASGVKFPNPEKIREGFQVFDEYIRCNISLERIKLIVYKYVETLNEPLVLTIRIPMTVQNEEKLRKSIDAPAHDEVYYLENCSIEKIKEIFNTYEEIFLNDGMSITAVTSQITRDWITILGYKIIDILGPNRKKAIPLLQKYGMRESKRLITAIDSISRYHPGDRFLVEINGKTIYDVVNELKENGMYLGKVLETVPSTLIIGEDS